MTHKFMKRIVQEKFVKTKRYTYRYNSDEWTIEILHEGQWRTFVVFVE